MAKKFFYVCAGLFLLALSYHLGAKDAGAQAGGQIVGMAATQIDASPSSHSAWVAVLTPNGDVYTSRVDGGTAYYTGLAGNIWGGGPVNVEKGSLGQLKARYR